MAIELIVPALRTFWPVRSRSPEVSEIPPAIVRIPVPSASEAWVVHDGLASVFEFSSKSRELAPELKTMRNWFGMFASPR